LKKKKPRDSNFIVERMGTKFESWRAATKMKILSRSESAIVVLQCTGFPAGNSGAVRIHWPMLCSPPAPPRHTYHTKNYARPVGWILGWVQLVFELNSSSWIILLDWPMQFGKTYPLLIGILTNSHLLWLTHWSKGMTGQICYSQRNNLVGLLHNLLSGIWETRTNKDELDNSSFTDAAIYDHIVIDRSHL